MRNMRVTPGLREHRARIRKKDHLMDFSAYYIMLEWS